MALGKQKHSTQGRLYIRPDELPQSPGHVFYDLLQKILLAHKFDEFAEELCAPFYADERGRPSIAPGRYFRMHLVGYFENINSERGLVWRCSDSLSLRKFLFLDLNESVPDHSSLNHIRSRLSLEVHKEIFQWVLTILKHNELIEGKRIGVDASTMEANAAMRNIVKRDSCESYDKMLENLCKEDGIASPTKADKIHADKKRKNKKLSNKEWQSASDKDARIARMKDKTTKMAYKPEHAVDLDSGAIVAANIHYILLQEQVRIVSINLPLNAYKMRCADRP